LSVFPCNAAVAFWRSDIVNHFAVVGMTDVIAFLKFPSIAHFDQVSTAICASFPGRLDDVLRKPIISLRGEE